MDIEKFFEKLFINSELADDICQDLGISRPMYTEMSKKLDLERKTEIQEIKRIRTLYHNKKKLESFDFDNFNRFYKWYIAQHKTQNGKCYYCQTDEKVIATLFEKKYHNRKRTTRGKHLEVERRDSLKNTYSSENCVLACYFCNNDKSDIFSEQEYLRYLKDRNKFLTNEYDSLDDKR